MSIPTNTNVYIAAYIATKSTTHGSWFIRVLVATFYKHCNHRDVESLFKIVSVIYLVLIGSGAGLLTAYFSIAINSYHNIHDVDR